jgi:hypothetical protein
VYASFIAIFGIPSMGLHARESRSSVTSCVSDSAFPPSCRPSCALWPSTQVYSRTIIPANRRCEKCFGWESENSPAEYRGSSVMRRELPRESIVRYWTVMLSVTSSVKPKAVRPPAKWIV